MSGVGESSVLGPAVFVGLSIYTVVTQGPGEPETNPLITMELDKGFAISAPADADAKTLGLAQTVAPVPETVVSTSAQPVLAFADTGGALPAVPALPIRIQAALAAQDLVPVVGFDQTADPKIAVAAPVDMATRPTAPVVSPSSDQSDRFRRPVQPVTGGNPVATQHSPLMSIPAGLPAFADPRAWPDRPGLPEFVRQDPAPRLPEPDQLVTSGDNVHLRTGPAAWYEVITMIPVNQRAIVLETRGNWVRIALEGSPDPMIGWMYRDYLTQPDQD